MLYETINIEVNQCVGTLTTYILDNSVEIDQDRTRPLVIVCPGGGYRFVSDREAEPIAVQLNAMGFHAAILRYTVYPAMFPIAITQLAKAVACVRENAAKWHVQSDRLLWPAFPLVDTWLPA